VRALKWNEIYSKADGSRDFADDIWRLIGDENAPEHLSGIGKKPVTEKVVTLENAKTFGDFSKIRRSLTSTQAEIDQATQNMVDIGTARNWMSEVKYTDFGTPWSRFVFDQVFEKSGFCEIREAIDMQIGGRENRRKLLEKMLVLASRDGDCICCLSQIYNRAIDTCPDIAAKAVELAANILQNRSSN